jgi:hypothetical protein
MITFVGDLNKPLEIAKYLESIGVTYVFGGKDQSLIQSPTCHFSDDLGAISGLDCSGFVGVCLWHMTAGSVNLEGLGSQEQGAWAERMGFKESTPDGLGAGNLYLFMLPCSASSDGIGHVGFVRDGLTAESYGHHGPGSRAWGPESGCWGWQSRCRVWVLRLGEG